MNDLIFNVSKETLYTVLGVMMGAICALHLLSAMGRGVMARIEQYANIFLHILLFAALLLLGVSIEITVLIFTVSLFVFVSVRYIRYRISEGRKGSTRGDDGERETTI